MGNTSCSRPDCPCCFEKNSQESDVREFDPTTETPPELLDIGTIKPCGEEEPQHSGRGWHSVAPGREARNSSPGRNSSGGKDSPARGSTSPSPAREQDPPAKAKNRYGDETAVMPEFKGGRHVPALGLINRKSGAGAGSDILDLCSRSPYYQHRFFDIKEVAKGGKQLEKFRQELLTTAEEADKMGVRARLISGGGDGTASFALFIVFTALRAEPKGANGLKDTGNGFIWTDAEMQEKFPALAQLPLGSANDFAHVLGWGQKYPGHLGPTKLLCRVKPLQELHRWFEHVIDPNARCTRFDLWGIMPEPGSNHCNFKICDLEKVCKADGPCGCTKSIVGKRELVMKPCPPNPVPFFVCLYFSVGFSAYTVARFQLNRHNTPLQNRAEYVRQGAGIVLERFPQQLPVRINGIEVDCGTCPYFPPRRALGNLGKGYRDVGFYNINSQANLVHGANRDRPLKRCFSSLEPVKFNDHFMDMYRMRFRSFLKNPGRRMQTDKHREMTLRAKLQKGQGIFFQFDGEARFAFSPEGKDFSIHIRRVLDIPVVLGPYGRKMPFGEPADVLPSFGFAGETLDERLEVRKRIFKLLSGELTQELNATEEELATAKLLGKSHVNA